MPPAGDLRDILFFCLVTKQTELFNREVCVLPTEFIHLWVKYFPFSCTCQVFFTLKRQTRPQEAFHSGLVGKLWKRFADPPVSKEGGQWGGEGAPDRGPGGGAWAPGLCEMMLCSLWPPPPPPALGGPSVSATERAWRTLPYLTVQARPRPHKGLAD